MSKQEILNRMDKVKFYQGLIPSLKVNGKPDIIQTIEKEGVELKQRGRYHWACCPLHSERTPSFAVNPEKQRFYCYGCHASGDSIEFIMKYKGLSFPDALRYLDINGDIKPVRPNPQDSKKRELVQRFRRWEQLYRRAICELLRLANTINLAIKIPEDLEISGTSEMYHQKDVYEYHLGILNGNDNQAKFELYKEWTHGNN